jgi:hypothetical protein
MEKCAPEVAADLQCTFIASRTVMWMKEKEIRSVTLVPAGR